MKRSTKVLAIFAVIFLVVGSTAPVLGAPDRHSGEDRYATAVEISKAGWEYGARVAVLARGDNFADALAGVPLAYANEAPILLTKPNQLPADVRNELVRLGLSKIFILGGTTAVSQAIEEELQAMGLEIVRIQGEDRYGTAAAIATVVAPDGAETVFLAFGGNFPDALAAASYAARSGSPILLTLTEEIPSVTLAALAALDPNEIIVVGGPAVIGEGVTNQLTNYRRVFGEDRYGTALALAEKYASDCQFMYFASGNDAGGGADALAGAALAAAKGTGILLVGSTLSPEVASFLGEGVQGALVFGGNVAVSAAVARAIEEALYRPEGGQVPIWPASVSGIRVEPTEMFLELNKTATIMASVQPGNAWDKRVEWSSSDENVATVADGVVTPIAVGTATITATTVDGGFTAPCIVTVIPPISEDADVGAGDFGVLELSGVRGYNVGFILSEATASDVKEAKVKLYKGGTVLATNISTGLLTQYPTATSLSAPFDVFGDFDYEADGCWDYSGWLGGVADIPTKAEIEVTFKNDVVKTVFNENLTGDTGIFNSVVFNMTQGRGYDEIETAVAEASDGDAIKLLANIQLGSTLVISDKTLTFNLNGCKLSTADAVGTEESRYVVAESVLKLQGNANITIQGPGVVKSGDTINSNQSGVFMDSAILVWQAAALTVKNESVIKGGDAVNSQEAVPAICHWSSGALTVNNAMVIGGDNIKDIAAEKGNCEYDGTAGTAIRLYNSTASIGISNNSVIKGGDGLNRGYPLTRIGSGVNQACGGAGIFGGQGWPNLYTCNIDGSVVKGGNSDLYNAGRAIDVAAGTFAIANSTIEGGDSFATAGENHGIGGAAIYMSEGNGNVSITSSNITGGNGGDSWLGCGIEYRNPVMVLSVISSTITGGGVTGNGQGYGNALYLGPGAPSAFNNVTLEDTLLRLGTAPTKVYGGLAVYGVNATPEELLDEIVGEGGYVIWEVDGSVLVGSPPTQP